MIPAGTTEDELTSLLSPFGEICELALIKKGDHFAKGYGFCRFATRKAAAHAIQSLHGHTFLHVFTLLYFPPLHAKG